jgi:hypothetical protein
MTIEKKSRFSLPHFVRKNWPDPVWSKVFASIIIAIGGSIIGLVWTLCQSLFHNVPFATALQQLIAYLYRSTPVNNALLYLVALLLCWLIFLRMISFFRKKKAVTTTAVESLPTPPAVPETGHVAILERYGFQNTDSNLLQAFKVMAGAPQTSSRVDGHYGEVMEFEVNMGPDDLDCQVKLAASTAVNVSYVYVPIDNFIFYLRIKLKTGKNNEVKLKWIALRLDASKVSGGIGQEEKAYPAVWRAEVGEWVSSSYHIPTVVAETFGPEGWTYHSLVGFRLRGKGKLESITLS